MLTEPLSRLAAARRAPSDEMSIRLFEPPASSVEAVNNNAQPATRRHTLLVPRLCLGTHCPRGSASNFRASRRPEPQPAPPSSAREYGLRAAVMRSSLQVEIRESCATGTAGGACRAARSEAEPGNERNGARSQSGLPGASARTKNAYSRIFFVSLTSDATAFLSSLPLANAWLTFTSLSTHIMTVTSASFDSLYSEGPDAPSTMVSGVLAILACLASASILGSIASGSSVSTTTKAAIFLSLFSPTWVSIFCTRSFTLSVKSRVNTVTTGRAPYWQR